MPLQVSVMWLLLDFEFRISVFSVTPKRARCYIVELVGSVQIVLHIMVKLGGWETDRPPEALAMAKIAKPALALPPNAVSWLPRLVAFNPNAHPTTAVAGSSTNKFFGSIDVPSLAIEKTRKTFHQIQVDQSNCRKQKEFYNLTHVQVTTLLLRRGQSRRWIATRQCMLSSRSLQSSSSVDCVSASLIWLSISKKYVAHGSIDQFPIMMGYCGMILPHVFHHLMLAIESKIQIDQVNKIIPAINKWCGVVNTEGGVSNGNIVWTHHEGDECEAQFCHLTAGGGAMAEMENIRQSPDVVHKILGSSPRMTLQSSSWTWWGTTVTLWGCSFAQTKFGRSRLQWHWWWSHR
jgi:hypothetical protein